MGLCCVVLCCVLRFGDLGMVVVVCHVKLLGVSCQLLVRLHA